MQAVPRHDGRHAKQERPDPTQNKEAFLLRLGSIGKVITTHRREADRTRCRVRTPAGRMEQAAFFSTGLNHTNYA